jgi:hypothetical protein
MTAGMDWNRGGRECVLRIPQGSAASALWAKLGRSYSRAYALGLMAQVISSQQWGVPAGAPRSVTVHVKNGWLPRATHGWRINSIGSFTWSKGWYSVVVLSMDNPTMSYGITTVEAIARVIHRDLNPTVKTVIPLSAPNPAWGTPDELIPALPAIP